MERIHHYKPVDRIKPLSFKKLILVLVLAGTIPFTALMQFAHYILIVTALFLLIQALVTVEPEKVSRYISYFTIAALFSFFHTALSWKMAPGSGIAAPLEFLMGKLYSGGASEFMVKAGSILALFLVAHTALVRYTVKLTGASTGLFMGKRIPEKGTGIIQDRGRGIILHNETIRDRRMFLRVGHYFDSRGNIGTMIYRSYILILMVVALMLIGVLLYRTGNPAMAGSDFAWLFGTAILHTVSGILPFTVITIATTLLAMRLTYRHSVLV